jgi:hypothetical protein
MAVISRGPLFCVHCEGVERILDPASDNQTFMCPDDMTDNRLWSLSFAMLPRMLFGMAYPTTRLPRRFTKTFVKWSLVNSAAGWNRIV